MQDPKNQIKLKRQLSVSFEKTGRCFIQTARLTVVVPVGLVVLFSFGKVRTLAIIDDIVLSAGVVCLLFVFALWCFHKSADLNDEAHDLEHSRDGLY
jgi:hypothetical protein